MNERHSNQKVNNNLTQMPNWSQILLTDSNRCHGPIAKTSYRGHSTVKPQHWSTWWMSDQNESSHGFTSFEFMHGEACQGREMMWTLALTVCQDFTTLPLATRLKLVICCLAACCQYAWESRFNIYGLLTGMNAIRLFCGCKASLCIHHAIYHFNGPQLSQGTHFNLVTALVYSLFYVSNADSKLVTHQWHIFFTAVLLLRKLVWHKEIQNLMQTFESWASNGVLTLNGIMRKHQDLKKITYASSSIL